MCVFISSFIHSFIHLWIYLFIYLILFISTYIYIYATGVLFSQFNVAGNGKFPTSHEKYVAKEGTIIELNGLCSHEPVEKLLERSRNLTVPIKLYQGVEQG